MRRDPPTVGVVPGDAAFEGGVRTPSPAAEQARALARLLDSAVRVPGTSLRFGLDPILGLIPGAGDLIGGVLSAYVLLLAARTGASKTVLLRMLGNLGVDAVVGAVPILGDLFDVGFKANARNVRLLEEYVARPQETARASGLFVALVVSAALLLALLTIVAAVVLVRLATRAVG